MNEKYTDEQVEKALAQTEKDMWLCEEFDDAVKRAKNLPLTERLKFVAWDEDRMDVFDHFMKVLTRPEVKVPEVERWIKARMFDGKTRTFKVTGNSVGYNSIQLAPAHTPGHSYTIATGFTPEGSASEFFVKSWEYTAAPKPDVPGVGDTIEVTTADGETETVEVMKVEDRDSPAYGPLTCVRFDGDCGWIFWDAEKGDVHPSKHRIITSWRKVEKVWKVGDMVPAHTVVGRQWMGRSTAPRDLSLMYRRVVEADGLAGCDRIIEWIED